ncbi:hypothetical protein Mgra_00009359 [Meloidogyne graminicola]|uniref:Uncharacterized protein n=1 Tax=Meloidogyne graminicola TaxID=189291 RepID=A0A8S9ZC17_9BILA|nr:hypothetical protein Mgra_00009359 [Meloidogyne graminicola]
MMMMVKVFGLKKMSLTPQFHQQIEGQEILGEIMLGQILLTLIRKLGVTNDILTVTVIDLLIKLN